MLLADGWGEVVEFLLRLIEDDLHLVGGHELNAFRSAVAVTVNVGEAVALHHYRLNEHLYEQGACQQVVGMGESVCKRMGDDNLVVAVLHFHREHCHSIGNQLHTAVDG